MVCCAQHWVSGHSHPQHHHHYCICEAAPATEEKYHLAIVDLLVGVLSGPMQTLSFVLWCFGKSWNITLSRINLAIRDFFPFASLVNLTFISLERVQATYRPFKQRLINKWVYGLVTAFIYLSTIFKGTIVGITDWPINFIWVQSSFLILLVLICKCYISIYIKVRYGRQHQLHGAAGLKERKLTSTLLLVAFSLLLTFLPPLITGAMIFFYHIHSKLVHLCSNSVLYADIILGQLANKSYSLCTADARI